MKPIDAHDRSLIEASLLMMSRAYAPYSRFRVGAALLDDRGQIHLGCNVENASYGLTICAERVAIVSAVAHERRTFAGIAVATEGGHAPCGACRQFLAEFAPDLRVLLVDANQPDQVTETSLDQLLPNRFGFT